MMIDLFLDNAFYTDYIVVELDGLSDNNKTSSPVADLTHHLVLFSTAVFPLFFLFHVVGNQ